jgi:hypothetical protein
VILQQLFQSCVIQVDQIVLVMSATNEAQLDAAVANIGRNVTALETCPSRTTLIAFISTGTLRR